jgi:acetyl esterase
VGEPNGGNASPFGDELGDRSSDFGTGWDETGFLEEPRHCGAGTKFSGVLSMAMAAEPHPQVQAVLDVLHSNGVPPTHGLSVESARDAFALFFADEGSEPVADIRELSFVGPESDVPVRIYEPEGERPHPMCVFFHGGGWVLGDLDCYDNVCTRLANRAGCLVVSVEYRLAPGHPFPAAPADCYAATEWAIENAGQLGGDRDRVAVAGDSAGGNLAAVISLMARDRDGPDITHQGLIYPAVNPGGLETPDSYEENAEGYFLELESMEWFFERYIGDPIDERNPYAFPLQARDLADLPPATIVSAGFDPLRDEDFAYEQRLDEAGVPISHHHFEDMIHGFCSMTDELDAAEEGLDAIADGLSEGLGT